MANFRRYVSTVWRKECEQNLGECVWDRIEPKLYFEKGLLRPSCGFGVDPEVNPLEETWSLDVSGKVGTSLTVLVHLLTSSPLLLLSPSFPRRLRTGGRRRCRQAVSVEGAVLDAKGGKSGR